jgi:plastocyanin
VLHPGEGGHARLARAIVRPLIQNGERDDMRRIRGGLRVGVATLSAGLGGLFLPIGQAQAAAPLGTTYKVGVDFATPAGHNWAAVDYFPRGDATYPLNVHSGDVVDFNWNTGSPDQLHTATLAKSGESLPTLYANNPFVGPDADDGPHGANFLFPAPTFPPSGSGAPGACGDATTPCAYDGTIELSSGAAPTAPGHDFFVQVNAPAGTTVTYACLIHPFMAGSIKVVAGTATTPAQAVSEAQAQTTADQAEAAAAETGAGPASSVTNADGTKTWTLTAGAGSAHTEVLEMLPQNLAIAHGDHVLWKTTTVRDIHTVTFPYGSGSNAVDPFPPTVCEGTGSTDSPAPGGPPPNFGCSSGTAENPASFGPSGPTTITAHAYRTVASDGGVFNFGDAGFFGSEGGTHLNQPVVGTATTPDGLGYWNVASDGGIFAHGDAGFFGSTGAMKLNKPVVGMASTPDGGGYLEVASDGGIFTFGDAPFLGSTGGTPLNAPVVGMSVLPGFNGPGYWEVASDGGIFSFGAATFQGSMGGTKLNKPVVGMAATPDGGGYWEVASDGGIFAFGDAPFLGSTGSLHLNAPIVGMTATPSGQGYWEVASDGGIFSFGDAQFYGSQGGGPLNKPMVGIAAMPATVTTAGVIATPPAPFPTTTATYTIAGLGAFTYQCRIHDHMRGVIVSS